jgi:hypothetical protein
VGCEERECIDNRCSGFVAFFACVLHFEFEMRLMLVRCYDECC